jgi:hypothetical protein
MAKGSERKVGQTNRIVDALVSAGAAKAVRLAGYPGKGTTSSTVRVYIRLDDLSEYYEVSTEDIVHQHDPEDPLLPSALFLKSDAKLVRIARTSATEAGSLLSGAICSSYLLNQPIPGEQLRVVEPSKTSSHADCIPTRPPCRSPSMEPDCHSGRVVTIGTSCRES